MKYDRNSPPSTKLVAPLRDVVADDVGDVATPPQSSRVSRPRASSGLSVEFDWNSAGIRLEFDWNSTGIRLEFGWNSAGIRLEFGGCKRASRCARTRRPSWRRASIGRS